jgi:hypothetical protein
MTDSNFESGRRSGIDDLIEHRAQPRAPAFVRVDEAIWRRYAYSDWLELWELVLLHRRIDPAFLGCEGFRGWVKDCRRRRNPLLPRELHMNPPKPACNDRLLLNGEQALKAFQSGELKKSVLYSKLCSVAMPSRNALRNSSVVALVEPCRARSCDARGVRPLGATRRLDRCNRRVLTRSNKTALSRLTPVFSEPRVCRSRR